MPLRRPAKPSCGSPAAVELHQFADLVANEPTPELPPFNNAEAARFAVKPHCVFIRTATLIDDVHLLGDIADAFKHHKLDRKTATITGAKAIVTLGSGYGEMHFGEGKYGGAEQVLVIQKSGGKRALSSILQNVFDAWMTLLASYSAVLKGSKLPPRSVVEDTIMQMCGSGHGSRAGSRTA